MAAPKSPAKSRAKTRSLAERTPLAEWSAATIGLILTLGVVGYTLFEGLTEDHGPPRLLVTSATATAGPGGFVLPVTVRNTSHVTAAAVQIRGVAIHADGDLEARVATFDYVPGRGEAKGGLVFKAMPMSVELSVEGYSEP